jgi:3-deoxy-7-phosphoheptulonate synthase
VESEEQIVYVAKRVKAAGATMLRVGAFKPRTSPYSFQGLHNEGLRLLSIAKKETGLPIAPSKTSTTTASVVTERFVAVEDMVPDAFYKRLVIAVE